MQADNKRNFPHIDGELESLWIKAIKGKGNIKRGINKRN